jgi:hypothetical protein
MNPFKKKIRIIPESYINETLGKIAAVKAEKKMPTVDGERKLVRLQRFIFLALGIIPSVLFLVNLLGFTLRGFAMEEPETNLPVLIVLAVCFVFFIISTIWELQGGIALIVGSIILGVYMYNMVLYFKFDEMIVYPIPYLASGITAVIYYVNKTKFRNRIRSLKKAV